MSKAYIDITVSELTSIFHLQSLYFVYSYLYLIYISFDHAPAIEDSAMRGVWLLFKARI